MVIEFVKTTNGWPSIDIGKMRHPIIIQGYGPGSPPAYDDGGLVSSWSTIGGGTIMAAMDPIRGTDMVRAGQTTSMVFITVAIWFLPGIQNGMRVTTEFGMTYVIQSIDNLMEMNVVLVLNCLALGSNF